MKNRLRKKLDKQKMIMECNDPIKVARHLVSILNEQGYSTKSYSEDVHHLDIYFFHGLEKEMMITNTAKDWQIDEKLPTDHLKKKERYAIDDLPF